VLFFLPAFYSFTQGDSTIIPNYERVSVVLKLEGVEFTHFGVQPKLCQYSLIGWSQIDETRIDIEDLYSLAVPKDKWESRELFFVPCNPDSIAQFVINNKDNWAPLGLAIVVLSLFQVGYGKKEIDQAFLRAQSR
jgi:hypothetical protein